MLLKINKCSGLNGLGQAILHYLFSPNIFLCLGNIKIDHMFMHDQNLVRVVLYKKMKK